MLLAMTCKLFYALSNNYGENRAREFKWKEALNKLLSVKWAGVKRMEDKGKKLGV